ncbi:hypothetical protein F4859DRAFT_524736 [Xylaria cf. heliscus]|nr:hypothetical protein F4859DRAFT_524736 [Xylaria cf. heliscus]
MPRIIAASPVIAASTVFSSAGRRLVFCFRALLPFFLFKQASAEGAFDPGSINDGTFSPKESTDPAVISDVSYITKLFNFEAYRHTGTVLRQGTRDECFGNLSLVLESIGPIAQASSSGSSGALTFLPTAGALIGAPAKEIWMLYKLVPLAGILSMLLSLGGNIVPNSASDYDSDTYKYDGIIDTGNIRRASSQSIKEMDPSTFAELVKARAENPHGGSKRTIALIGIISQIFWIGVIVFACWLTESGAILAWWCQAWGWMLGWYLVVGLSSLFENFVLVPFTKQWTLRVSKAPNTIEISDDAPSITPLMRSNSYPIDVPGVSSFRENEAPLNKPVKPQFFGRQLTADPEDDLEAYPFERQDTVRSQQITIDEYRSFPARLARHRSEFLHNLEKHGYNTVGKIRMDPNKPWASNRHSFMVIISMEGVTRAKGTLRVISKAVSVGVFAAGTAAFASATLITISVALIALCLILGAGVFGRVAAIWMVSEMMKEKPVIHRVVHGESEAEKLIQEILNTPGLTVEFLGHVFINGKCVQRYNRYLSWFNIFGILVSPYNVENLITGRMNRRVK